MCFMYYSNVGKDGALQKEGGITHDYNRCFKKFMEMKWKGKFILV